MRLRAAARAVLFKRACVPHATLRSTNVYFEIEKKKVMIIWFYYAEPAHARSMRLFLEVVVLHSMTR